MAGFEDHEERVAAITEIAVELKALVPDGSTGELTSAEDPA
jgi:hypothetical protein